jgi:DNA-binding XRE family transcriptional regulator
MAPVRLKSLKTLVPATEPQSLADHLKRRRRELCLRQLDAAKLIGVDEETY